MQKKFTHSDAVIKTLKEYRQQSDSVQLFLKDEDYVKDQIKSMPLKKLYQGYRDFCRESGYNPTSAKVFASRLRNVEFEFERKRAGWIVFIAKKSFVEPTLTTPAAPDNR